MEHSTPGKQGEILQASGHSCGLHSSAALPLPGQESPLFCGAGLSHALVLVLVPPSQVREQSVHWAQSDHSPSTENIIQVLSGRATLLATLDNNTNLDRDGGCILWYVSISRDTSCHQIVALDCHIASSCSGHLRCIHPNIHPMVSMETSHHQLFTQMYTNIPGGTMWHCVAPEFKRQIKLGRQS